MGFGVRKIDYIYVWLFKNKIIQFLCQNYFNCCLLRKKLIVIFKVNLMYRNKMFFDIKFEKNYYRILLMILGVFMI